MHNVHASTHMLYTCYKHKLYRCMQYVQRAEPSSLDSRQVGSSSDQDTNSTTALQQQQEPVWMRNSYNTVTTSDATMLPALALGQEEWDFILE